MTWEQMPALLRCPRGGSVADFKPTEVGKQHNDSLSRSIKHNILCMIPRLLETNDWCKQLTIFTETDRELKLTSDLTFDFKPISQYLLRELIAGTLCSCNTQSKARLTACDSKLQLNPHHTHENINRPSGTLKHTHEGTHADTHSIFSSSGGRGEVGLQTDCWGNGLHSSPLIQPPLSFCSCEWKPTSRLGADD